MSPELSDIAETLRSLKGDLKRLFGVSSISVFGSWARGEQTRDSDLDLLVEFDEPPSLFGLARLDRELGERLGLEVECVPRDSLNPRYAPFILPEAVPV